MAKIQKQDVTIGEAIEASTRRAIRSLGRIRRDFTKEVLGIKPRKR